MRIRLENADRERLGPCNNLGYAIDLVAKLNAKNSIDCLSAV